MSDIALSNYEHPIFGWDVDADGIVTITMDDPTQSANTMTEAFIAQLAVVADRLVAEKGTVRGVVLASGKKTFFAGGDLGLMMAATPADAALIHEMLESIKRSLRRVETLGVPVVAAINGAALGGGFEIALACHHRVALDAPGVGVGLPEVTLGLLPGAGGTTRTVRLLGLVTALQQVLLTGKKFSATGAVTVGLVDELVDNAEELIPAAKAWVLAHDQSAQPWDQPGYKLPGGKPGSAALANVLAAMPAVLRKQTRGAPNPAAGNLLAAAVEGAQVDFDSACAIESRYCTELICGQISTNIIKSMFFDMQAITRGAHRPDGYPVQQVLKVVVLGAGMMGAGIAYVCASAGIDVVLKDISLEAAERGKAYSLKVQDKAIKSGRSTPAKRDALLARITPSAQAEDATGADLLIEAVFEDADLKRTVIAEVLPYLATGALVASNTSTLPISDLAAGVEDPAAFIGLHFFSPVDRMALLEIVVGKQTSDAALAQAIDFALRIRKTPIVVNDSRGFFTSRVIGEFINEAVALVGEGVPPASIEQAATQAGYPVGALALIDELTLTLMRKIRVETKAAQVSSGAPDVPHPVDAVINSMIDDLGRRGRSTGGGFYDYVDGRKAGLWPGLADQFGGQNRDIPLIDMQERMLFAEAIDSIRCLDSGVLRSVGEANVGSILGIGFPAWTGGVLQYVNQYDGGLGGFVARAHQLAERYGERFTPPGSLLARAEIGDLYL